MTLIFQDKQERGNALIIRESLASTDNYGLVRNF